MTEMIAKVYDENDHQNAHKIDHEYERTIRLGCSSRKTFGSMGNRLSPVLSAKKAAKKKRSQKMSTRKRRSITTRQPKQSRKLHENDHDNEHDLIRL